MKKTLILNLTKDAFAKYIATESFIPAYNEGLDKITPYFDKTTAIKHLKSIRLDEGKEYIQYLAAAYDNGDIPYADIIKSYFDFAKIVTDVDTFLEELITIYYNEILYHLSISVLVFDENTPIESQFMQELIIDKICEYQAEPVGNYAS